MTTAELDRIAEEMTRQRGAEPAFKGYEVAGRVFPRSVCISINDEVVHGIPSERRVLQRGRHRRARLRRAAIQASTATRRSPWRSATSDGEASA